MFKNNLLVMRIESHKKQYEIAEALNMNVNVYGRYERGDRDIPLSIAIQLADMFDVSLDYLACRSESKKGIQADEDNQFIEDNVFTPLLDEGYSKEEAKLIVINNLRQSIAEATSLLNELEKDNPPE